MGIVKGELLRVLVRRDRQYKGRALRFVPFT